MKTSTALFWGTLAGIIISFTAVFLIAYFAPLPNEVPEDFIHVPIPERCSGLHDIVNASYCLVADSSTWFKFAVRDDFDRTFEDLKENGGDCYDYSLFYAKQLRELGFNASIVTFNFRPEELHAFTLVHTEHEYCILDQTAEPFCMGLGETP